MHTIVRADSRINAIPDQNSRHGDPIRCLGAYNNKGTDPVFLPRSACVQTFCSR